MRQYPLERLIKNIGTNNKTVAALLQPRFCAYKKAVIAVRVSGGHLCDAEAPTEPAGETAVRRVAIRIFPIKENTFFCPAPEIKLIFGCNYT